MPTARADAATTNANTAVRIAVLGNDSGPSLTILSVTTPANGTAKINSDKTITYTPKLKYTGTDTFKYTIRDGAGAKSTAKVTVTVRNRAPVAGADGAATDANTPVRIAVLANDSDPDGHVLSLAAVTQPANGAVVVNTDKTVTYTPTPGFTGSDGFSYSLSDGRGGSAQGAVSVTVRNRPPVAGADSAATDADTPVTITVLANDSDPDGHALTVSAVTQPTSGAVVVNSNRTLTYTPAAGFTGSDAFTYTIGDGRGGSAQGAVAVTVRNRAPLAEADSAATDANTPVTIAVLANDSDPDGHALTVASVGQAAHGTAAVNPDGSVRYAPEPAFTGVDSFTYTIADGHGGTAQASVALTVRNRLPVAGADSAVTNAYASTQVSVLANDNDPDGHALAIVEITQPAHGTAAILGSQLVSYTPTPGFMGTDSFDYTVADGRGGTALGTVAITVRGWGEPFADGTFFTDATGWASAAA